MSEIFNEAFLCRQSVVDEKQNLVGYQLSFLHTGGPEDQSLPDKSRSAHVCAAYAELGIRTALGQNMAFLPVDEDFLHDEVLDSLPHEAVVLDLQLGREPDSEVLARCRALREKGYSLALADFPFSGQPPQALLSLLDIIKIDIRKLTGEKLDGLLHSLAEHPVSLLAQGIERKEEILLYKKKGFTLFQGDFFAKPEVVSGVRLSASQASLIKLINFVSLDVDVSEIEASMKHEPALAVNLLNIVNSVGFGLSRKVSSLRHAITILGRRYLLRWLQLLLMLPPGESDMSRSAMLLAAALRGRMMESLVKRKSKRESKLSDQAFITGIMSMMPAALGIPMDEIFKQINLEEEVVVALSSHSGVLGKTLALMECFDARDIEGCEELMRQLPELKLDRLQLNMCLIDSLCWISGSQKEE